MKVSSEVFDKLKIEKIFPPAKEHWNTLYVQFTSVQSVQTFYRFSKHLRKNQRLVPYITRELYPRFRELQSMAYTLRHSDMKYKTRVKILNNNLVLSKRSPSESTWTTVLTSPATNLQIKPTNPVQLNLRPNSGASFNSRTSSQE